MWEVRRREGGGGRGGGGGWAAAGRGSAHKHKGFRRDAGRDAAAAAKPGHARFCLREYLHHRRRCAGVRNPRQVSG